MYETYENPSQWTQSKKKKYADIPDRLLACWLLPSIKDKARIEKVLSQTMLGNDSVEDRFDRLLSIWQSLSSKSQKIFQMMIERKAQIHNTFEILLQNKRENNEKRETAMSKLCGYLSLGARDAFETLKKVLALKTPAYVQHFENLTNLELSYTDLSASKVRLSKWTDVLSSTLNNISLSRKQSQKPEVPIQDQNTFQT